MAVCDPSRCGGRGARAGRARPVTGASRPSCSIVAQKWLERSGARARSGWSASSSSITPSRATRARVELALFTTMPGAAWRTQLAASVRSPSISTMQARQLPSAR